MRGIRSLITGPWMIVNDFNLILQAQDKNNDLLNRRLMNKFRRVVDDLDLQEVHLNGRAFTWTSAKERPTLGRIDSIFVSIDWEHLFPDCFLRALPSTAFDHCPLLLSTVFHFGAKKNFWFESFWTKIEGFEEAVQIAWHCYPSISDPLRRLDFMLKSMGRALQSWSQRLVGIARQQIVLAKELIWRFDVAEEIRILSTWERWFRAELKKKMLDLCSLERTISPQRSRLRWLRQGDANTHFSIFTLITTNGIASLPNLRWTTFGFCRIQKWRRPSTISVFISLASRFKELILSTLIT